MLENQNASKKLRIAIRADASVEIGSGHVVRCLGLAKELQKLNCEIEFICCECPGDMRRILQEAGFFVHSISSNEIVSQFSETDSAKTAAVLGPNIDLLICDHYQIDRRWESSLRSKVRKILVIDDLADRPHDCDFLIDQNYYLDLEQRYDTLVPKSCTKWLGPHYAILRSEFISAKFRVRKQVKNILVFFGGSDPTNETEKSLAALSKISHLFEKIYAVIGASNQNSNSLQSNFTFPTYLTGVSDMASLMNQCDLSVGGGGTTTWERCRMGLPSIIISIAPNQEKIASDLDHLGAAMYLGPSSQVTAEDIEKSVIDLTINVLKLSNLSLNSKKLWPRTPLGAIGVARKIYREALL